MDFKQIIMKTRNLMLAMLLLVVCSFTASAQKKVAILGDSYSTFAGYLSPATNFTWYSADLNSDIAISLRERILEKKAQIEKEFN